MNLTKTKKKKIIVKEEREAKRVSAHRTVLLISCIVFLIYSAILAFPFIWMLFNSFKDKFEFASAQWSLPAVFRFENYATIFELFNIGELFGNTLVLCLTCPTLAVISTTFAAYALSKFKFKGQKFFYFIHILPIMVQITGGMSAMYFLIDRLHLLNTYFALIVPSAVGTGMNFLLVYALFRNVSDTYMEAATIDGAGYWRVFIQIMLPQAMGIIGTLWVLGFIGTWNDYASARIYMPSYLTIGTGIKAIGDNIENSGEYALDYPRYFAAIIVSVIPIIALFLLFQKQIMRLSLGGGIKG